MCFCLFYRGVAEKASRSDAIGVWFGAALGACLFGFVLVKNSVANAQEKQFAAIDFDSQVAPLLIKRCVECHQGTDPSGGLSLTSREGLVAGGDSGDAFDVHHPTDSYLSERIRSGEMPPEKQGRSQKLADSEIELLGRWIDDGAKWPERRVLDYFERTSDVRAGRDWWSLQPVVRPTVPMLEGSSQPDNPIDAFIGAELAKHNVKPAPRADRRTLIRRLYYDVIGLPPSESAITAFENDQTPDAWAKLVDRVLEMPQYGERWARYWLDLARYADTSGYERDQEKPFAWKYRDWVVQAFNSDMPYDQFIIEQIAGDEIDGRTEQSVIATGFLRLGTWNDEPNDRLDYQYERLEDLVHTTSSAFFGLTVKCARCHSHKFDAITQTDYYRMASAFWAGPLLTGGKQLGGPTAEQLGFDEVLAWTDTSPKPKPLHRLKNGERDQPLEEVVPASLSFIPSLESSFDAPPADSMTSHRRRQLAEWIANPEHPLTSRVLVNRLWQHHFGQAIVRTPNNFGFLADPPTHPKLLDWLASEFDAGGRRMKSIHRLILNSQTWQQGVLHPRSSELEKLDSTNRLCWHAERQRLDAEALRDSLLAVSGELDLMQGGGGFKATISPDALEGLSRKSTAWQAAPVELQTRRSLYMYLKRGLLPPMMTTFDQSEPTLSCGQRNVTIVPTQALALLNNRFVHDRSEQLATVIQKSTTGIREQVKMAWRSVLKRQPNELELQRSIEHVATQDRIFSEPNHEGALQEDWEDIVSRTADSLVLNLNAENAVTANRKQFVVESVSDLSGHGHHATQSLPGAQPTLVADGIGGKPALQFDGGGQFMNLAEPILAEPLCTIVCVVRDDRGSGHRTLISNWSGRDGNSTSSLFLGLTAENTVRFSDAFGSAGEVSDRAKPFILSAVNGQDSASVFQNGQLLKSASQLPKRRLDTSWVIGQQGNIDGEFWKGRVAEIRVYDRALKDRERRSVETQLAEHYGILMNSQKTAPQMDIQTLALASLCHVLMNSNEFLFID
ncbi:DUF1549 domain-containing protein [bacterium]|nr:DUF1549 domain-containing protein [bacterium]